MLPLVFVHGVTVRDSPEYRDDVEARDAFFRRLVLDEVVTDAKGATILNPLWGEHGAMFRWNHASLPTGAEEALGPAEQVAARLLAEEDVAGASDRTVLLKIAQRSLVDVIDILWAAEAPFLDGADAVAFAERAIPALDYAKHNPNPEWLKRAKNDDQLLRDLLKGIDDWTAEPETHVEILGRRSRGDRVREAAARLKGVFGRGTGVALVAVGRSTAHRKIALFIGDVFEYLSRRGTPEEPGDIPKKIIKALQEAVDESTDRDDKLVVVAHSMGGNIVYDVLTHFLPKTHPTLHVDIFVTVGSQVGLFEELKLFAESDIDIPDAARLKVPKPQNVGGWLNVFDTNDILGFAAKRIFEGVEDFGYSTGKGVFGAHVTYFLRPSFYERLGARLRRMANP